MSNSAARLIALALIIFTGGILLGTTNIAMAMNSNRQEGGLLGYLLLFGAGLFFIIEMLVSIRRQE